MEGLILLGAYVIVASAMEAVAIGIGFFTDNAMPAWSSIIFIMDSGLAFWLAWPAAVWITGHSMT